MVYDLLGLLPLGRIEQLRVEARQVRGLSEGVEHVVENNPATRPKG